METPQRVSESKAFLLLLATLLGAMYMPKKNNFYNLNLMFGKMRMLADKGRKSGVDIGLYYGGGLSLGFAKPYYLELIYGNGINFTTRDERYQDGLEPDGNANIFLNPQRIYGASGFSFGLNEMKIYPGAKAKVALVFDWANYNEFVKALEVGAMANVYASRVPILVALDDEIDYNKFLFMNLYVKFMFGKRW